MSCNLHGGPDAKKPCKGILKTSSSFDKHSLASHRKSAKFDELNVLQTFHPHDKDYGHMKIDEPKTPYRISESEGDENSVDQLDAELLAEKLRMVSSRTSVDGSESSSDEDETDDQKIKRKEFESRRKMHYNEFDAVRRARKLMEEEDEDDAGEESSSSKTTEDLPGSSAASDTISTETTTALVETMDVDDTATARQSTSSNAAEASTATYV